VRQLIRPRRLVGLVFVAFEIETQGLEHLGRKSAKRAHRHASFSSGGGDNNSRREERVTGHPQAAPAVARERIPATPNGVERDLGAAVSAVPSGTTTGVARRQSSGRGLAERA